MSVLNNSNAIESGGYNIDRSLRFRSSASAYLNRTPASTSNRKTWTWSGWVKRGALSQTGTIWGSNFSSGGFGLAFGNYGGVGVNPEYIGVTLYAVGTVTTNAVFRDPSAWYHIVAKFDSTQATQADRFALYVNGVKQTLSGTLNVTLNADYNVNLSGALHVLGGESGYYNDLYLAEVNFIDGQALTPSSFGQTDAVTGVWTPKKYTGTYGTNGFYLDFKNNTSATTLAYDKSGNGNNWTANNISTTAGATYDSMTDVPTLTSATAANTCTLNPLDKNAAVTFSDGNLTASGNTTAAWPGSATMVLQGKQYFEVTVKGTNGNYPYVGIMLSGIAAQGGVDLQGAGSQGIAYKVTGGTVLNNGTTVATYATAAVNDVLMFAYDQSTGYTWIGKNGTWFNSGAPASGTGYVSTVSSTYKDMMVAACEMLNTSSILAFNFGQQPFSYTPPTGFKALNTFNLPDPVIKKPNQYMDVATWTAQTPSTTLSNNGDGTWNINLTGITTGVDLAWGKCRNVGHNNVLDDSVRGFGSGKNLNSNNTSSEGTDNDGYVISTSGNTVKVNTGNGWNGTYTAGQTYVGWFWKKGATPGFDIVTYTGTGSTRTVSHSLGVAPSMIITKIRNNTDNWAMYHKSVGNTAALFLSTTGATNTNSAFWNNTSPTSSDFTVGSGSTVNFNGGTYVAYLFAEIPGFSKFGRYTGNGSTDGPFVYCGFRPKYILWKRTDSTADWTVFDSSRDTYNVAGPYLNPNTSAAELTDSTVQMDLLSNGFKIRGTWQGVNASGGTIIFAAFAENPFKYSLAR